MLNKHWEIAMSQARLAAQLCPGWGDVPVGALVIAPLPDIKSTEIASTEDAAAAMNPRQAEIPGWQILARTQNQREKNQDPTAHAEILALRQAAQVRKNWHLNDCTLVITLEPCAMCAGAAVLARVQRVVFGAWDEKAGAGGSLRDLLRDARLNHQIEVIGGVEEDLCNLQLQNFFSNLRKNL